MALKALTPDLFAEVTGAEPVVLALHGWGRDRTDFAAALAGIDTISVDLPGFGASPPPSSGWTTQQYAAALLPVVAGFAQPPILVGHSFGGRIAAHLATMAPVRGVVFIGTPLFRPLGVGSKAALGYRCVRWLAGKGIVSEARLEAAKQKYGSADYRAAEGVMRDVLVKAVNESYEEQLSDIAVPVHMVWGADDSAAPVANIDQAKAVLKAPPFVEVAAGVGHDVHLHRPELVKKAVECLL